jgi:DNA-binding SARP family transcriptional activator
VKTVPPTLPVRVRVLGPLTLSVAGKDVPVPGVRRRALLATLALARGRVVGVDRLVDTLWPDDPPGDAAQALYSHVSRLRGDLREAGGRLTRQGLGYVLALGDDEVDASVVRAVAAEVATLPADRVVARTAEALRLWRGPASASRRWRSTSCDGSSRTP